MIHISIAARILCVQLYEFGGSFVISLPPLHCFSVSCPQAAGLELWVVWQEVRKCFRDRHWDRACGMEAGRLSRQEQRFRTGGALGGRELPPNQPRLGSNVSAPFWGHLMSQMLTPVALEMTNSFKSCCGGGAVLGVGEAFLVWGLALAATGLP